MYARMTLLEIDTLRTSIQDALDLFRERTVPRLREQPGYRGIYVMTNPDGKAALLSLWETEEQAASEGDHSFYSTELGAYATFFRSTPGRDRYEVVFMEEPTEVR